MNEDSRGYILTGQFHTTIYARSTQGECGIRGDLFIHKDQIQPYKKPFWKRLFRL